VSELDVRADDHVLGDPDAPVTLLEYGDYECPYCAAAAPVLRRLVAEGDGSVRLVFRNYPLPDVHPHALTAALAAEAAAAQGAFWEMHELLFERQDRLSDADLRAYGDELGLVGDLLVGEAAQPFGDKVEADFALGVAADVPGTPTIFIDGVLFSGRPELSVLQRAVAAAGGRSDQSGGVLTPGSASGGDAGLEPGAGRQRPRRVLFRRAQREPLTEEAQQQGAQDRCGQ
jgi:protein-disulfide isomerase